LIESATKWFANGRYEKIMKVGVLTVQLRLHGLISLKEKRSLMKHTVHQLRKTFNVAVAEVDHQDNKRAATIGIVCVANKESFVFQMLDQVIKKIEHLPDCDLETTQMEVWP
jgi:hypothetical protein